VALSETDHQGGEQDSQSDIVLSETKEKKRSEKETPAGLGGCLGKTSIPGYCSDMPKSTLVSTKTLIQVLHRIHHRRYQ
jgi:hypothetical protein